MLSLLLPIASFFSSLQVNYVNYNYLGFLTMFSGRVLTVIVTLGKKFVKSERWKNRRLCSFKKAGAYDSDGERSGLLNSS